MPSHFHSISQSPGAPSWRTSPSSGEELITHRFPEITAAATRLPEGTVLDGEVLAFKDDRPMLFSALQQRIGRQKQVAQMSRAVPVVFMVYDILEADGADIRQLPLEERRTRLERLLGEHGGGVLRPSPLLTDHDWDTLAQQRSRSRELAVEGLMIKRRTSPYGTSGPFTLSAGTSPLRARLRATTARYASAASRPQSLH